MEQQVISMSFDDDARIEAQRSWVRDHYASQARVRYESVPGKLALIQRILDAGWVDSSETYKLQCLGITFGDALAQELKMEWVTVEDEHGRDPALRFPGTTVLAFPLTMISKRIERSEKVSVTTLFCSICDDLLSMKADPQYQRH
jgi:Domain of unknown function (DUF3806)